MRLRTSAPTAGLLAGLAAVLALILPGVAGARQPGAIPTPIEGEFVVDGICEFPLLLQINGSAGEIELPGGRLLFTSPGQTLTATNLDEPSKSVTLAISGTFTETALADGSVAVVAHGPSGLFDPALGFVVIQGNFSWTVDSEGNAGPASGVGNVIDVCASIA